MKENIYFIMNNFFMFLFVKVILILWYYFQLFSEYRNIWFTTKFFNYILLRNTTQCFHSNLYFVFVILTFVIYNWTDFDYMNKKYSFVFRKNKAFIFILSILKLKVSLNEDHLTFHCFKTCWLVIFAWKKLVTFNSQLSVSIK